MGKIRGLESDRPVETCFWCDLGQVPLHLEPQYCQLLSGATPLPCRFAMRLGMGIVCMGLCGRWGGCPSKVLGSQGMLGNGLPLSAHPGHPLPSIPRDSLLTWSHVVPVGSRASVQTWGVHGHTTPLEEDHQALLAMKHRPQKLRAGRPLQPLHPVRNPAGRLREWSSHSPPMDPTVFCSLFSLGGRSSVHRHGAESLASSPLILSLLSHPLAHRMRRAWKGTQASDL